MTDPTTPTATDQPRKSRKGCLIFAGLAALGLAIAVGLLFVLGAFFSMIGAMAGGGETRITGDSILEIQLTGPMIDAPPEVELGVLFGEPLQVSVWELRRGLAAAAEDPSIRGARVWIHNSFAGWGAAEEVVRQLDRFRESGKPLHVLLQADMVSDVDYFLATGGEWIWATPQATSAVNGLAAEAMFLRGALDKLHIEPHVIMYEEYKSAGEQFGRYEMSEPMREALTAVLADVSSRFEQRVIERRGVEQGVLDDLLAQGVAPASSLLEAGLVDELGFVDQVNEALRSQAGLDEYRGVGLGRYLDSLGREGGGGGSRIAVVFGEGTIISEPIDDSFPFLSAGLLSGPIVAEHLRDAIDDERVAAILFRVNSPGGSPVGSDLVLREVERAVEIGKPVIVSMGDVAGSGGYWVAMKADAIVAEPTTITGSIGVVFTHFDLEGFYQWLGINVDTVATEPNADLLSFGEWTEEDVEAVRDWMDETYLAFTRGVAEGRDLEYERVLEIARGRIWSGADALELGLVDRLGGLDEAVALAKERGGFDPDEDVPVVVYPQPKTLFQQLMELSGGAAKVAAAPPDRAALLGWARALARPRVQALMPEVAVR